jgi:hypothetical protein
LETLEVVVQIPLPGKHDLDLVSAQASLGELAVARRPPPTTDATAARGQETSVVG